MVSDFFETTSIALTDPLVSLWNSFVNILPGLVAAIIILIIGYVVAYLIGHAIRVVLDKAGLDKQIAKARLSQAMGRTKLSAVLGEIVKWYIFIIFLQSAADIVELGTLSVLLSEFVGWLPHVIAGIIVLLAGLVVAHYVAMKIREHTEIKGVKFTSEMVKWVVLFVFALIAAEEIGFNLALLRQSFLVVLAGIALALGLAFGLSFGLGLKGSAQKRWEAWKKYV